MVGRKRDTTVYTFDEEKDPLILHRGSQDWLGYWISNEQCNNRRMAKCSFCHRTVAGRPESLIAHKTKQCHKRSSWPTELLKLKRPAAEEGGPMNKFVKVNKESPDDVRNKKFAKALISTSVPFSFVDNYYVKDFFKETGINIPNR